MYDYVKEFQRSTYLILEEGCKYLAITEAWQDMSLRVKYNGGTHEPVLVGTETYGDKQFLFYNYLPKQMGLI